MVEQRKSLIPGVILIIIGVWFFARDVLEVAPLWHRIYPILLILFAGFLIYETVQRRRGGSLFWGVVLLLIGGFFLARNFNLIPYFYGDEYWPIFMVAMGLGFLALFVYKPQDWGVLIPGGVLLFFGVGFGLHSMDILWGWEHVAETYWPVVVILLGLAVLARSLIGKPGDDARE